MTNRFYGWIKNNKSLTIGLIGYSLGMGSIGNKIIYDHMRRIESPKSENVIRINSINEELEEIVSLGIKFKDILNRDVMDSDYARRIKAERDSLENLPSYTQERLDYEKREEKIEEKIKNDVYAMAGTFISVISIIPLSTGFVD